MLSSWMKMRSLPILYVLVAVLLAQLASASPVVHRNLEVRAPAARGQFESLQRRQGIARPVVASIDGGPVDMNIVDLIDQVHIVETALQVETPGTPEHDALLLSLEELRVELDNIMEGVATFVGEDTTPQTAEPTGTIPPVPQQTELPQTESTGIPIVTFSDEPTIRTAIVEAPNVPPTETQVPVPPATVTVIAPGVPSPEASGVILGGNQDVPVDGGINPQPGGAPRVTVTLRASPTAGPTGFSERARGGGTFNGANYLSPPMRLSAALAGVYALCFTFVL